MKKICIIIVLISVQTTVFSQEGILNITKTKADSLINGTQPTLPDGSKTNIPVENQVNKGIDFGISLGFNDVFNKVYDAHTSPIDNKVEITSEPKMSFLLSTGLSVALSKGRFGGRYYRKLDAKGIPYGSVYFVPYGLCFIATVNLVTFNSAATGGLFNKRLDGGLGVGYKVNDNLQLSLTYEMISYRQPRPFLISSNGQSLAVNSKEITSLDLDDPNYFRDKYFSSLSFKFFYLLKSSNK